MIVPFIGFNINNNSQKPLSYLALRFLFFENKTKIFDDIQGALIGGDDVPLDAGIVSKDFFVQTTVGFEVRSKGLFGFPEVTNLDDLTGQKFDVKIYFKTDPSQGWEEYGKIEFSGQYHPSVEP